MDIGYAAHERTRNLNYCLVVGLAGCANSGFEKCLCGSFTHNNVSS